MEDFDFYSAVEKKQEKGVFARFYDKYEKTDELQENGLPKYENRTWVEIRVRDSYDVVDTRATREHIMRFPQQYAFYQTKKEKMKDGTPLNMFAFLNPAQIECCEIRGVYTVEQLAQLSDAQAMSIGLYDEQHLAKKFIEMQGNNKEIKAYEDKIKELENTILKLTEQINALQDK